MVSNTQPTAGQHWSWQRPALIVGLEAPCRPTTVLWNRTAQQWNILKEKKQVCQEITKIRIRCFQQWQNLCDLKSPSYSATQATLSWTHLYLTGPNIVPLHNFLVQSRTITSSGPLSNHSVVEVHYSFSLSQLVVVHNAVRLSFRFHRGNHLASLIMSSFGFLLLSQCILSHDWASYYVTARPRVTLRCIIQMRAFKACAYLICSVFLTWQHTTVCAEVPITELLSTQKLNQM